MKKSKVFIRLKDKQTGEESEPVTIEELIYHQNEIEFIFNEFDRDSLNGEFASQLPYKDFLFFQDDYEVIVKIK